MIQRRVKDLSSECRLKLTFITDRIRDFLSKFKGSQEKDLERNFANIDIRDDNGAEGEESTALKYMQQLVRVITRSD